jgi:uncharacterized phiE125 gp8 family phage protein
MLVEETSVPSLALPVTQFKDHLRLGTGFPDDAIQDPILESFLRSAIAAIEARTSKALIERSFSYTISDWRDPLDQLLPVAPVTALVSVKLFDANDVPTVLDPGSYWLVRDTQQPRVRFAGSARPSVPNGGSGEITFVAGFGPNWSDIPADLAQAVFLLAAHYYEHRQAAGAADAGLPFGVSALIQRFRSLRIFAGRGA